MSLEGVVVIFSSFILVLSVEDALRLGGFGRCAGVADSWCFGEFCPFVAGCEFMLLSDLIASFVENIRVRRFVIEGFSAGVGFCGSEGGAACPFPLRFSRLATEGAFCLVGFESGEPSIDDVCEAGGDGFRAALTVAMFPVGIGCCLGSVRYKVLYWLVADG